MSKGRKRKKGRQARRTKKKTSNDGGKTSHCGTVFPRLQDYCASVGNEMMYVCIEAVHQDDEGFREGLRFNTLPPPVVHTCNKNPTSRVHGMVRGGDAGTG